MRNGIKEVDKLIQETLETMEKRGFLQEDVERFLQRFPEKIEQNKKKIEGTKLFKLYKKE